MLFNSFEFLVFFVITTTLFFLTAHRLRWLLLLMASCVFYMYFIPVYIFILFFTIIIDYFAGIFLETCKPAHKKFFLVLSLIANIGILLFFKYFNFFVDTINTIGEVFPILKSRLPHLAIILPIGLSFHTFQAMSYTIEVYRGNQKAERHLGIYALYVMFYPQLVAGPIERPQHLLPQLREKKKFSYGNLYAGLRLILWGLFKKSVIADRLAVVVDMVFDHPSSYHGFAIIVATIFFAIQIYCDFSGYSDIALGTAQVMGFKLMKNFRQPYFAKNISDFWARWHISLSSWFRDYLYIPLGGNRVRLSRLCFNLMFVFVVSGFWHGASWTFIVWGAVHGLAVIVGVLLKKQFPSFQPAQWITTATTLLIVCGAWIFFRANSLHDARILLRTIFSASPHYFSFAAGDLRGHADTFLGQPFWRFLLISLLVPAFLILDYMIYKGKYLRFYEYPRVIRWSIYYIVLFAIIVFGVFAHREFIYFQF